MQSYNIVIQQEWLVENTPPVAVAIIARGLCMLNKFSSRSHPLPANTNNLPVMLHLPLAYILIKIALLDSVTHSSTGICNHSSCRAPRLKQSIHASHLTHTPQLSQFASHDSTVMTQLTWLSPSTNSYSYINCYSWIDPAVTSTC